MLWQMSHVANPEALIDYKQSITKIDIAADERSAMVETRATLGLPGLHMTFRTRDKVIRKRWKTLIAHSEGTAWVGPAYQQGQPIKRPRSSPAGRGRCTVGNV
ncbi:hypothetical protein BRM22_06105 [Xanthomonas oryzae pv. oryzae]|uniref:Uncharacterized protein n=3 Tax=Xanthomonas oryzae pv. oryzae TaxID=64187 RepID=Q5GYS1_XANOR|nr:conserved hypothetical protein [Xanthomonas oryzae pv. oryzae KACC 10331]ACD58372.1 hypothetical protein PXO_00095 [Xanthomonas oryzae pv. oryzae PXO99A]AJQ82823.1 hypothetical protein AZ54_09550 [Xanthomonas oryzae pv. oryzae PXO86]ALZ71591.1 hypothetical protein APZ20_08910 [Xanthomonas oryzae pv. oryzae]QUW74322.1 hypothetical protein KCI36_13655 [Xanthomonas oryzae]